jgi:putative membrane protein
MVRRVARLVPLLLVVILGLVGAGSLALAHDGGGDHHSAGGDHHRSGHHKGCDQGRYSAWDEEWLMMSIEGDRFEIAGGRLAQSKGTIPEVRGLGARVVKDHTKSLEDAIKVAEKLGIEVPRSPSPTQQWQLRVVATFSGRDFNRWYSDLEVQDHKQDIKEATDEVEKGCNRKVRHLAKDDLPVLRVHLGLAQAALDASTH